MIILCGYLFENPNIINYLEPEVILTEENETSKLKDISLIPWILITSDTKIPVQI